MHNRSITTGRLRVSLFEPDTGASCPLVYIPLGEEDTQAVAPLLQGKYVALAAIDGADWNRDLSPWPAPRAFRGGEDFTGGADGFLREITDTVLPEVENTLLSPPTYRAIAGYSLAGLFALYALYRTDAFRRAGSFSGSLWYDYFTSYMRTNKPLSTPQRVCFSLGEGEKSTKNPRLAAVEDRMREAEAILAAIGVPTCLETHPGGHFRDIPNRIARGISCLIR